MNSVYDYSDFRIFIKDFYEQEKKRFPGFSYRFMSQKAEVASSAFFKLVIEGKRNLTKNSVFKTSKMLKLNNDETLFFEQLVFFNQAKTVDEKNHYFSEMVKVQKKTKAKLIGSHQMNYFAEWYHPVVRELVSMPGFKGDLAQVGRMIRPSITQKQVEFSVRMLEELGFLTRKVKGWEQTEPVLKTEYGFQDFQILQYQIKVLELSIESFDRMKETERLNGTTTLAISRENLRKYVDLMRDFRRNLQELAQIDQNPDMVYILNTSFFPASHQWKD
jgi:uncharacterized protein (TIGR02147 family)